MRSYLKSHIIPQYYINASIILLSIIIHIPQLFLPINSIICIIISIFYIINASLRNKTYTYIIYIMNFISIIDLLAIITIFSISYKRELSNLAKISNTKQNIVDKLIVPYLNQ